MNNYSLPEKITRIALLIFGVFIGFIASPSTSWAFDSISDCASLQGAHRTTAQKLLSELHPYDGCDQTFSQCLARPTPSVTVKRIAADVCRMVQNGKNKAEIERLLTRRGQSSISMGRPASIALDERTRVGDKGAPITLVLYACARCPFCAKFVTSLHNAVTEGNLKGTVKLYFRPFPLKGHPGAVEGGIAMIAAAGEDKFWPYLLHLYQNFDSFNPSLLSQWAQHVGLDRAAFDRACAAPSSREALEAAKKEGLKNKVEATPTLFINGRKYVYELNMNAVIDVILEEAERLAQQKQ